MIKWVRWSAHVVATPLVALLMLLDFRYRGGVFVWSDVTFWMLLLPWHGWNVRGSYDNGAFTPPWREREPA